MFKKRFFQWGRVYGNSSGYTNSFPISFPSVVYQAISSPDSENGTYWNNPTHIDYITLSNFKAGAYGSSGYIWYLAIGK